MPRRGKAPVRGWDRAFDDPIPLPNGCELVTLRDAGDYIAKLPKREHDAPESQADQGADASGRARRSDAARADRHDARIVSTGRADAAQEAEETPDRPVNSSCARQ
jgi:hypothetical protein